MIRKDKKPSSVIPAQAGIRSVGILQLQINPQTEIPSFPRKRESRTHPHGNPHPVIPTKVGI
ncbi:hypothetical protein C7140_06060 [Neisseria gonorrhoeae]